MNQPPYGGPPPAYPPQGYPQPGYPQPQGYPQAGGYPAPYAPYPPRNDDESHLSTLAICHFCYAGLVGLVGLFFGLYLVIGVVIAGAAASSSAPEAAAMGGVLIVIGGLAMLFTFTKAALLVWSGLSLRKRVRPTLSFVVACLSCLNIPLGTTLGVFTIVVLNRPSVKALYARTALGG